MITTDLEYDAGYTGILTHPAESRSRPGILVLHGGAGPSDHERERAHQLAELGYVAFAPDLFGAPFTSRAHGMAVIGALVEQPAILRARLGAALACLRAQPSVDATRTGAIGFCFGGLAALELARSGADIAAVVSFHGGLQARAPATPDAVRARVLVCAGGADPFVTREQRAAFEDEMTAARADWQLHIYGGALHGFTERAIDPAAARPGCAYDADADRRSWHAMRALFAQAFAPAAAT